MLRKKGYSYNKISRETGVAKGMLSYWFNRIELPEEILKINKMNNLLESRNRMFLINLERKSILKDKYDTVERDAEREFGIFKKDPVFIASLMLYLGEGDKSDKGHSVRISNTDPSVLIIFKKFLEKYCCVEKNKIKFWMLGYSDLDINSCISWWKKQLNIDENNMYKTQIIVGKHKTNRLLYGVGNITISGKSLKIRVIKWIRLMCSELMRP